MTCWCSTAPRRAGNILGSVHLCPLLPVADKGELQRTLEVSREIRKYSYKLKVTLDFVDTYLMFRWYYFSNFVSAVHMHRNIVEFCSANSFILVGTIFLFFFFFSDLSLKSTHV